MEKFQECRDEAEKRLKTADHLLTVTHQLVKDPKLLLTVVENLYYSYENGMNSLLEYERLFKNISAIPESFQPRVEVFSDVAEKHGISKAHVEKLKQLRNALSKHNDAPVEFKRGKKFVIADDDFDLETLSPDSIKEDVEKAKEFVQKIDEAVKENERIFR